MVKLVDCNKGGFKIDFARHGSIVIINRVLFCGGNYNSPREL